MEKPVRVTRDVADDAKSTIDKASDAIKDFLTPETWDVSKLIRG